MKWFCVPPGEWNGKSFVYDMEELLNRDYFNQGDGVITDSMFRIVGNAENGDDVLMIRGANVLRSGTEEYWDRLADLLDRFKFRKVVAWSIGLDAEMNPKLPASFYEVLPQVDHWGVRGDLSKLMLQSYGAKDVSVVHCPTLLRGGEPPLQMREIKWLQKVMIAIGPDNPAPWVMDLAKRFKEEGKEVIFHVQEGQYLYRAVHTGGAVLANFYQLFQYPVRYSQQAAELDELVREVDLVISTKLHAALPALAQGTPTYMVNDTWRMREIFLELNLPMLKVEDVMNRPAWMMYDAADFNGVERAQRIVWNKTREWLDRIGVGHCLQ